MNNYKDLKIWQKAFDLSIKIYESTKTFPESEKFGLVSQMRRASISVFSNIAEGHGRISDKDFVRFLYMALGSTNELEGQILISEKFTYIAANNSEELQTACQEIQAMLMAFIKKIS